jgi:hypothetical protein
MIDYGDVLIRQIKNDQDKRLRFDNGAAQKRIRKYVDFGQASETKPIMPLETSF